VTQVLVIDDDAAMRRVIRLALESDGAEVTEAEGGSPGLELIQSGTFALVVLDWNMPGLVGPEVLTELRRTRPELPVLMLTAELSTREGGLALAYGATAFLAKPFSGDDLRAAVTDLVR
jgi:DNA-binding response OmpR family regulator